MIRRRNVIVVLALFAAVAAGAIGTSFAAREAGPSTGPELVSTYDQLANAILGTKNAETSLVKAICADAWRQAKGHLDAAAAALQAGDGGDAARHLENAAQAVYLISQEGDKAVALVRNRLLEGGHHHHATAEIAEKYPPGFVVITKEAQKSLLMESTALGKLAAASAEATAEDVLNASKRVEGVYRKALE